MSNKFARKQAPLPGKNSKFKIENSKLGEGIPHSALSTQSSSLPEPRPHSALSPQSSSLHEPSHPLAQPSHPRIDVLHGGSQYATMRDVLTLVRQSLTRMEAGESALVINTCAAHALMEEAARKISRRQAAKMLVFTADNDALLQRLEFLEHVIETKQVRLLVLTAFEFAACYSRQRIRLVHWMRRMRDAHSLRIVVYSIDRNEPHAGAAGALGLLAWAADLVRPLHMSSARRDISELPNTNQTLLAELEEIEDGSPSFRAQREIPSDSADSPSQPGSDVPTQDSALSTQDSPNPDPTQDSALSTFNSPTPRGLEREFAHFQTTRQLTREAARLGNAPLINKELQPQEV